MSKKFALITGAGGLLGPEHASALAEIGFNLILLDVNKKKLNQKTKVLKKNFPNIEIYSFSCDITSEPKIKKLSHLLKKKKFSIDVLINNADVNPKMDKKINFYTGRIEDYRIKDLKKELDVGLVGTFICCKIFGSQMSRKNYGIIINIVSDLGLLAPNQEVYHPSENIKNVKNFKPIGYSISKHGILGITKYISTYWAHRNVRCNALIPGGVLNNQPSHLVKNQIKRIPMKRWAKKSEFKKAIQFLSSDGSKYMTGQNLVIDGGKTVW